MTAWCYCDVLWAPYNNYYIQYVETVDKIWIFFVSGHFETRTRKLIYYRCHPAGGFFFPVALISTLFFPFKFNPSFTEFLRFSDFRHFNRFQKLNYVTPIESTSLVPKLPHKGHPAFFFPFRTSAEHVIVHGPSIITPCRGEKSLFRGDFPDGIPDYSVLLYRNIGKPMRIP